MPNLKSSVSIPAWVDSIAVDAIMDAAARLPDGAARMKPGKLREQFNLDNVVAGKVKNFLHSWKSNGGDASPFPQKWLRDDYAKKVFDWSKLAEAIAQNGWAESIDDKESSDAPQLQQCAREWDKLIAAAEGKQIDVEEISSL